MGQAVNFHLQYLTFEDQNYGGTYLGGGQERCIDATCTDPMTELIIGT
jgi:hypothetical protein